MSLREITRANENEGIPIRRACSLNKALRHGASAVRARLKEAQDEHEKSKDGTPRKKGR
jgi:hypothetical protein